MVVMEDGMLSPTGSVNEFEKNYSDEEIREEILPEDEIANNESALNTPKHVDKGKKEIQKLRFKANLKKKKGTEPLDKLVSTCTTIGHDISNILNQKNVETHDEDYYFAISMTESLKKIENPAKKLKLKASFLVQLADAIKSNN